MNYIPPSLFSKETQRMLRTVSVSPSEKAVIRSRLLARLPEPERVGMVSISLFLRIFATSAVGVLVVAAGLVVKANSALPGERLYSVKRLTENFEGAFASIDSSRRVAYEIHLAEKRAAEVAQMTPREYYDQKQVAVVRQAVEVVKEQRNKLREVVQADEEGLAQPGIKQRAETALKEVSKVHTKSLVALSELHEKGFEDPGSTQLLAAEVSEKITELAQEVGTTDAAATVIAQAKEELEKGQFKLALLRVQEIEEGLPEGGGLVEATTTDATVVTVIEGNTNESVQQDKDTEDPNSATTTPVVVVPQASSQNPDMNSELKGDDTGVPPVEYSVRIGE